MRLTSPPVLSIPWRKVPTIGKSIIISAVLCFFLIGCAAGHSSRSVRGMVQVYDTSARVKDRSFFFGEEYDLIRKRRRLRGITVAEEPSQIARGAKPARLIGLTMSGGGIRSNAFNLGVLSGLHFSGALKYVDYLSAVSGGSWAAGNYRATNFREEHFFPTLDRALKDRESTAEDIPLLRGLLHSYVEPMKAFKDEILKAPKRSTSLLGLVERLASDRSLQKVWREMIRRNFLANRQVRLTDLARFRPERPMTIINGAHDTAMDFEEAVDIKNRFSRNFPFEFAPLSMGTMADCGNTKGYCTEEHRLGFEDRVGVYWDPRRERNSPGLDRAMAISSSWLPALFFLKAIKFAWLEWDHPVPQAPGRGTRFRGTYQLTDGGHSENLGALPLLERGVDFMIVSDATADTGYHFRDFQLLKTQADRLLGAAVKLDTRNEYWNDLDETVLFGRAKTGRRFLGIGGDTARILYLKPKNTLGFRRYLMRNGYEYVAEFLRKGTHNFPFDQTIVPAYPPELVRAYYLLGRYIAAKRAGPLMLCYTRDRNAFPDDCGVAK